MKNLLAYAPRRCSRSSLFSPRAAATPILIENVHGYTLVGAHCGDSTGWFSTAAGSSRAATPRSCEMPMRGARRIDGKGRTLLPGLIDAHGHVIDLGFENVLIELHDTQNLAQAQQRIREYAAAHPDQRWLLGGGWNQVNWKLGRFPLASELDAAVTTDRQCSTASTVTPSGSTARHCERRESAGRHRIRPAGASSAMPTATPMGCSSTRRWQLVERVVPPPSDEEQRSRAARRRWRI